MTPYTLKESPRARHIRITIRKTGEVAVTKPRGVSIRQVQQFIQSKEDWIQATVATILQNQTTPDLATNSEYHFLKHKPAARALTEAKLDQWNALYQFDFKRLEIKRMTSRWGSCSTHKTLCFNYKILFLPEELQDYLVVHELCHLAEMNHSAKFWAQVERGIPNYRELRKKLRVQG